MAKNKQGFEKGVNIEIDDLLKAQALERQKAKAPTKNKQTKKATKKATKKVE